MSSVPIVSLDAETRWIADLPRVGAVAYFDDPDTSVFCLAWHLVGSTEPVDLWRPGVPVPAALAAHVRGGGKLAGWNVIGFDRHAWDTRLVPLYGFPPVDPDSWVDSMQLAAAANLPRGLDGCAAALKVPYVGDLKDQAKLLRITSIARTPVVSEADRAWLENRCVQDVTMEEGVLASLPPWPLCRPWAAMPRIDRRINDRGVLIDMPLVKGLARVASLETARLSNELADLTDNKVSSVTMIESLKAWLIANGVDLPPGNGAASPADEGDLHDEEESVEEPTAAEKRGSPWRLRKTDIADLLAKSGIPEDCRMALAIRTEAAKASVRKLRAMVAYASPDDRLRGLFRLGGAQQTMRWCLAEGSLVRVKRLDGTTDEISIETVSTDDMVWDGDQWVAHKGVVFSGIKEVIEHDNIVATEDHQVYVSDTEKIALSHAKKEGRRLYRGSGS